MDIKQLSKRKGFQIAFLIFSVAMGVYSFHGFVDLVRQRDTHDIMREFGAAVDELQKSPPGIERAEIFLKRLKAIDPGHAPAEVKQALHDYISAMEQGIDAMKAGQDSSQYDEKIAEARERLITQEKKWENRGW
jgi:hypothetical protein